LSSDASWSEPPAFFCWNMKGEIRWSSMPDRFIKCVQQISTSGSRADADSCNSEMLSREKDFMQPGAEM